MLIAFKLVKLHIDVYYQHVSEISKYNLQNALNDISRMNSPKHVILTLEYFIFLGLY